MGLAGLMWSAAKTPRRRVRALALSAIVTAASLYSYVWLFESPPTGISGRADATGYCRQTSQESCSAAAAVMLLNRSGIITDEKEMAGLCLTRTGKGTPTLGLLRGLVIRSAGSGWRPEVRFCSPSRLRELPCPAIISVGVSRTAPDNVAEKMREYGWARGEYHSVVVLGVDGTGRWADVADPSYGREKWPAEHLAVLWDGRAVSLARR